MTPRPAPPQPPSAPPLNPQHTRALEVLDRAAASYSGTRSDHRALEHALGFLQGELRRLQDEVTSLRNPPPPPAAPPAPATATDETGEIKTLPAPAVDATPEAAPDLQEAESPEAAPIATEPVSEEPVQ